MEIYAYGNVEAIIGVLHYLVMIFGSCRLSRHHSDSACYWIHRRSVRLRASDDAQRLDMATDCDGGLRHMFHPQGQRSGDR